MVQGLLIIEALRSRSDTPHSVGLLWTSDQPRDAYLTTQTHSMAPVEFEPAIPADEQPPTHDLELTDI
jgi:hypothetical protein